MSSVGMGILLSANVTSKDTSEPFYVHEIDGPFKISEEGYIYPKHWPVPSNIRKTFIFDYDKASV
jgi:hypothetical protein